MCVDLTGKQTALQLQLSAICGSDLLLCLRCRAGALEDTNALSRKQHLCGISRRNTRGSDSQTTCQEAGQKVDMAVCLNNYDLQHALPGFEQTLRRCPCHRANTPRMPHALRALCIVLASLSTASVVNTLARLVHMCSTYT